MMEEKKPKNKTLLYLILILIIIGIFIVWKEVVSKDNTFRPMPSEMFRNIEINYQALEDSKIKDLIFFEEVVESEESGRENPFESY
jgi:hypothetical protein